MQPLTAAELQAVEVGGAASRRGWHERPQARGAVRQVLPSCRIHSLRSLGDTAGRIMAQKREQ